MEEGEMVDVSVKADTPHEIKWTKNSESTEEETVHSDLRVGEGKRKLVDLEVSQRIPGPTFVWGVIGLLVVLLLLLGFGINRFLDTEEKVDSLQAAVGQIGFENEFRLPVGTLMPYAGRLSNPERAATRLAELEKLGWCPARGQLVSRPADPNSPFAALHEAVDVAWGSEQGQFKFPDLRGQFVRGVQPDCSERTPQDDDYGPCDVGGRQEDATRLPRSGNFSGVSTPQGETYVEMDQGNSFTGGGGQGRHGRGSSSYNTYNETVLGNRKHDVVINSGGDTETRPKNVAVNWLVYVGEANCPEETTD
jgi:hypothetical protein